MSEVGNAPFPEPRTDLAEGIRTRLAWDDLRVFLAVAEAGSISAAARLLAATPGMVSKRIADLEATLCAHLCIKHAQGVDLTDAGKFVLDHARTIRRSVASIERTVGADDDKAAGRVTVKCTDGVAAYVVAPALGPFLQANPSIEIAIDCDLWHSTPLAEGPDLVVTIQEDKRLDYVVTRLATIHYVLAASKDYIDTYGAPSTLAAIADHRFVEFVAMRHQKEAWHPRIAPLRDLTDFSVTHNSSAVHFEAVRNGAGIGLIPTFLLKPGETRLLIVHPEAMFSIQYYLSYHMAAAKRERVRLATQWIKGLFDGKHQPWFRPEFIHPADF